MLQHPGSVGGLRALQRSGVPHSLLDVREPPEADAGHVAGASVVPLGDLELRLDRILPVLRHPVVVYDGGDGRATVATQMIARHGVDQTHVLQGGFAAWCAADGPVARGRNVPSKRFGEEVLDEAPDVFIEPHALEASLRSARPPLVIDVRTPGEHRREHIPTAVNAPGFSAVIAARDLADPTTSIVVHCTGRTRGIIAARTLRLAGFPNAHALHNGTMGWLLAGLTVERGSERPVVGSHDDATLLRRARVLALEVGVRELSPEAVSDLLEARTLDAAYAFDLRDDATAAGHADAFVPVGSGQLIQQLDEHMVIRGAGAVLACEGGPRAYLAGYWLRRMGVEDVYVLEGGLPAWQWAGLPWCGGQVRHPPSAHLRASGGQQRLRSVAAAAAAVASSEVETISVDPSPVYEQAHLPGAGWVPRSWLEATARERFPALSAPLLVTCRDGYRSALAADALRRLGFEQAHALAGGVEAWAATGHDVETGRGDLPSDPGDVWRHPLDIGPDAMRAYLDWEVDLADGGGCGARTNDP